MLIYVVKERHLYLKKGKEKRQFPSTINLIFSFIRWVCFKNLKERIEHDTETWIKI